MVTLITKHSKYQIELRFEQPYIRNGNKLFKVLGYYDPTVSLFDTSTNPPQLGGSSISWGELEKELLIEPKVGFCAIARRVNEDLNFNPATEGHDFLRTSNIQEIV